jgi:hypothetical protein
VIRARNAQALFVLPGASSTLLNNNNNPDGESSPTSFGEGHNEDSEIAVATKNRGGRRNIKEPHRFQRHWLLRHFTNRDTGKFHFYIHPDSKFKQAWSFVIVLFLLYVAFLMPYFIAFQEDNRAEYWKIVIDMISDFVFLFDVLVTCFSAYFDDKQGILITDNKEIFMQYFQGWFVIDMITSIPITLID